VRDDLTAFGLKKRNTCLRGCCTDAPWFVPVVTFIYACHASIIYWLWLTSVGPSVCLLKSSSDDESCCRTEWLTDWLTTGRTIPLHRWGGTLWCPAAVASLWLTAIILSCCCGCFFSVVFLATVIFPNLANLLCDFISNVIFCHATYLTRPGYSIWMGKHGALPQHAVALRNQPLRLTSLAIF